MPDFVSVIIPCRDEEKFIGKCLDSIINQDCPKEGLEVLVVDGCSKDQTKEIVKNYSQKHPFIKIFDNPKKTTPCALNIGIKEAKGDVIIRMDAHAGYKRDYIQKCVEYLQKTGADNVGGVIKTMPANNTNEAKAVALILSHPFGAGLSYFRIGTNKPREVDTVFGGCYRKDIFNKIGYFNENLARSQDMEFNLRLKKNGGKIILVPEIKSYYYPKSTLWEFFEHSFQDGVWAIYPLKFVKIKFKLRHYVPLIFVSTLILCGLLGIFYPLFLFVFEAIVDFYLLLVIFFAARVSLMEKNVRIFPKVVLAFTSRHFAYGLGSIWGVFKLLFQ